MSITNKEPLNVGNVCRICLDLEKCMPSELRICSRLNGKTCTVYEVTRSIDGILYRCVISGESKDHYFSRSQLRKLY